MLSQVHNVWQMTMVQPVSAEPTPAQAAMPRLSRLPLAMILLALLALGTIPIIGERYVATYRDDLRVLVEPARNLSTEVHVSLALGGAALRDYVDTRHAQYLESYRSAT